MIRLKNDLGAVDPGVALDPVGRAEGERDEDGHDDERPDGELAGQRALAVNVRVGQDVVELIVVLIDRVHKSSLAV